MSPGPNKEASKAHYASTDPGVKKFGQGKYPGPYGQLPPFMPHMGYGIPPPPLHMMYGYPAYPRYYPQPYLSSVPEQRGHERKRRVKNLERQQNKEKIKHHKSKSNNNEKVRAVPVDDGLEKELDLKDFLY